MPQTILIELKPSKILAVLLWLLFLGCVSLLYISAISIWLQTGMMALGLVLFIQAHRLHVSLSSPHSNRSLVINQDEWLLILNNGRKKIVTPENRIFLSPQMTILNMKVQGKRQSIRLFLCQDNCDKNQYRRLRVRLRFPPGKTKEIKHDKKLV